MKESNVGQIILGDHKIFAGYFVSIFNKRASQHGIDHVLKGLNGTVIDEAEKGYLKREYDKFMDLYKDLVEKGLNGSKPLKDSIEQILNKIKSDTEVPTRD